MAERPFTLESVLAVREAELETVERDLSRIGGERSREKERTREMHQRKEEGLAFGQEDRNPADTGFLLAWYGWLSHMDQKIGEQERREKLVEDEFERVRELWKKALMEKEKILVLRERHRDGERRRTMRMEERSLDLWIQSRGFGRNPRDGEGS